VTDKPKALAEVKRVLRVGGRFGLTTLSNEVRSAGTLISVVEEVVRRDPYASHVDASMMLARPGQTTTELLSTVIDSKLRLEELHITPRAWSRASGKELFDFLESSSFGNFLRVVPDDLRGTLQADLIEAFDSKRGPDGRVVLRDWFTLLVAERV
jgi:hypothetical protein